MSVAYPFLFTIPKPSQVCSKNKEPLAGQPYCSALFENDTSSGFDRLDFCLACWEEFQKEEAFNDCKSFWKSTMPSKKEIKTSPDKFKAIFNQLEQLLQESTEEAAIQAYLLVLYLARKKQMVLRKELLIDQVPSALYEVVETQQMIGIKKMDLSQINLQSLQEKLAPILAG